MSSDYVEPNNNKVTPEEINTKLDVITYPDEGVVVSPSSTVTPPTPARRCAPVREAVDPAKYVSIQEGDITKFACSKCGNVYKWKKSLNKHWKEKHDGEIPQGPPAVPRLPTTTYGGFASSVRPYVQELSPPTRIQPQPVYQAKKHIPRQHYQERPSVTSTKITMDGPPPAHSRPVPPTRPLPVDDAIDLSRPVSPQVEPLDLSLRPNKNEAIFKCQQCARGFNTLDGLNQHFLYLHGSCLSVALHHNDALFTSSDCGASIYTLTKETPQQLNCMICGVSYMWIWAMEKHFQDTHPGMKNPYQRDTASSEHSSSSRMDYTARQLSSGQSQNDSESEQDFYASLEKHNTAVVYPEAPEETRRHQQQLRAGMSSVDFLLPYKCNVCEYRARWPSEITQHMKNHSDEKPFACPRCSYRSKWKWDVVKHLKRCGGGTVKDVIDTSKRYRGSDSSFDLMGNFCKYMGPPNATVLGDSAVVINGQEACMSPTAGPSQDDKPFGCGTCNFTTKWKSDLLKHCRSHQHSPSPDVAKWRCNRCDFCSDDLPTFLQHRKSHVTVSEGSDVSRSSSPAAALPSAADALEMAGNPDVALLPGTSEGKKTRRRLKKCRKCGYVTDNVTTLHRHLLKHGKAGKFRCEHCDYSVDKEHVMQYHTSLVHGPSGGQAIEVVKVGRRTVFKCRFCGYSDPRMDALQSHVNKHEALGDRIDLREGDDHDDVFDDDDQAKYSPAEEVDVEESGRYMAMFDERETETPEDETSIHDEEYEHSDSPLDNMDDPGDVDVTDERPVKRMRLDSEHTEDYSDEVQFPSSVYEAGDRE